MSLHSDGRWWEWTDSGYVLKVDPYGFVCGVWEKKKNQRWLQDLGADGLGKWIVIREKGADRGVASWETTQWFDFVSVGFAVSLAIQAETLCRSLVHMKSRVLGGGLGWRLNVHVHSVRLPGKMCQEEV